MFNDAKNLNIACSTYNVNLSVESSRNHHSSNSTLQSENAAGRVETEGFFKPASRVNISGGTLNISNQNGGMFVNSRNISIAGGSLNTTHEQYYNYDHNCRRIVKLNSDNVTKTRIENVGNRNLHLHLHYTEVYSKSSRASTSSDTFNADACSMVSDNEMHFAMPCNTRRRSKEGVFSRPLDIRSKKNAELKKTFKSLMDQLNDDVKGSDSDEEESCESEYFSVFEEPPLYDQNSSEESEVAHTSVGEERSVSAKEGTAVDNFVQSMLAMQLGNALSQNAPPNPGFPPSIQSLVDMASVTGSSTASSTSVEASTFTASCSEPGQSSAMHTNAASCSSHHYSASSRSNPSAHHLQQPQQQRSFLAPPPSFPISMVAPTAPQIYPFPAPKFDFWQAIQDTVAYAVRTELQAQAYSHRASGDFIAGSPNTEPSTSTPRLEYESVPAKAMIPRPHASTKATARPTHVVPRQRSSRRRHGITAPKPNSEIGRTTRTFLKPLGPGEDSD